MYEIKDTYEFSDSFCYIDEQLNLIHNSFVEYIENGMKLVNQKETQLSESLKKMRLSHHPEHVENLFDDQNRNISNLRTAFLTAGLMYVFSQFEYYLGEIENKSLFKKKIVSNLEKQNTPQYNASLSKTNKSTISKLKDKIVKKCSLENTLTIEDEDNWIKISDYYLIRNCITHNNGLFKKEGYIERFKKNYPSLRIYEQSNNCYELLLTKEFLLQVENETIKVLRRFMELIFNSKRS